MVEPQADDIGLSAEERARLRFQLENCSITKKHRRAAVAAAHRRSRAKTGGRKHDPHRPHPDTDRFIANEMSEYADQLHQRHHPLAKTAKAKSDAIRRCIRVDADDHQPCGSTACSRCRTEMADSGRKLGELITQKDLVGISRSHIRAATILLFAVPMESDSPDPITIADDFRHHLKILRAQAEEHDFAFLFLPEFKILTPLKIVKNRHMRAYVDIILLNWRRFDRVLIANVHGLIVFLDDHQEQISEYLHNYYQKSYSLLIKRLFNHQATGHAISEWMYYSSLQEDRHDVPIRIGRKFTKLYHASDFLLIDQILEQLSDDETIFEFSPLSVRSINDEDQWTWEEILEDLLEVSETRSKHPTYQKLIYVYYYSHNVFILSDSHWYHDNNRIILPIRGWSGPRGPPR